MKLALTNDDLDDLREGATINAMIENGKELVLGADDFEDGQLDAIERGETVTLVRGATQIEVVAATPKRGHVSAAELLRSAISQYLDLSSAHLPQAEMHLLSDAWDSEFDTDSLPTRVIPHAYGAWVWVQDDDAHEQDDQFTEDGRFPHLLTVIRFARERDCHWVNFDRDGLRIPQLPSWEW